MPGPFIIKAQFISNILDDGLFLRYIKALIVNPEQRLLVTITIGKIKPADDETLKIIVIDSDEVLGYDLGFVKTS